MNLVPYRMRSFGGTPISQHTKGVKSNIFVSISKESTLTALTYVPTSATIDHIDLALIIFHGSVSL